MSGSGARSKQRLRTQAEHHLRIAAMDDLRRDHPAARRRAPPASGARSGAALFVPLYRRMPWEAKERAMRALRMTADTSGWTPPARVPGEPWRPPAPRK